MHVVILKPFRFQSRMKTADRGTWKGEAIEKRNVLYFLKQQRRLS